MWQLGHVTVGGRLTRLYFTSGWEEYRLGICTFYLSDILLYRIVALLVKPRVGRRIWCTHKSRDWWIAVKDGLFGDDWVERKFTC